LTINEQITALAGAGPFAGANIAVSDRFSTHNEFWGGQIGVDGGWTWGRWSLDGLLKLALGGTYEAVNVAGGQSVTLPGGGTPTTFVGGLLALPGNIGFASRDRFAVVPEVGVKAGVFVTEHLRLTIGYTFLYWSDVVRPGDQIDRALDETRIPNFPTGLAPTAGVHPALVLRSSDFWAQGLSFGCEFRY
jgi:hypothetical protein